MLLAGELGRENLPESLEAASQLAYRHRPVPPVPALVGTAASVLAGLRPLPGEPHGFTSHGISQPREVSLRPLYSLNDQRYTVYWDLVATADWPAFQAAAATADAARRELTARTVDAVAPGEQQPETDHAFTGENTSSGTQLGYHWRDTGDGGWFSYELAVCPGVPQVLRCTWWGSDAWNCEFEISGDGHRIANERLRGERPGEFFQRDYPLPAELLAGSRERRLVRVRFQAKPGSIVGRLFGCAVLRSAT